MANRAAICAVAQIPFESNLWQQRVQGMVFPVVKSIMEQTGVSFGGEKGIQNVVTCSDDVFDARTISDNGVTDEVGAHYQGEEKVAMDGVNAIAYALACILSGHDDVTMVVAHCKESQSEDRNMCTNLAFDPFYCRPVGLDYLNLAAMQARAYMDVSGITDKHLAKVVELSRKNAAENPLAIAREPVSAEEVMKSPMICDPIRDLHVYPVSDGAIAMLIANEDRCREFTDKPVWITGFGNCMDSYFPGDRNLASNFSLKRAAERAYIMAGVTNPEKEFDMAEVHSSYAYQLPMWCEGLGLCGEGNGGEWIDGGGMEKKNVNPSGGPLGGFPIMVGGLAGAAEAVLQLRGEAGKRQIYGAKKALAHGTTGAAGQHHAVMILENK